MHMNAGDAHERAAFDRQVHVVERAQLDIPSLIHLVA
jgi:hypothetical protein